MASASLEFPTSPERTFEVLAQPRTYGFWVPGAHEVEPADPNWPAPGSTFRHEQGVPPLSIQDTTSVLACEPPRHLRLEARVRPLLIVHIDLMVEPRDGGCRVTMDERPVGGVLGPVLRLPPFGALLRARNLEALRRMRKVATGDA